MTDNIFFPLSIISAPAILMNACAILQNGTHVRYNLAITQLREFRNLQATNDNRFLSLYTKPDTVVKLAGRRINLILYGLNLLYVAVGLFGLTTFTGLFGALLGATKESIIDQIKSLMGFGAGLGVLFMIVAVLTFFLESMIARSMLKFHMMGADTLHK